MYLTLNIYSVGKKQTKSVPTFVIHLRGSVAEWSKALVLGTSLSGGVGSNPTAANRIYCEKILQVERNFLFNNENHFRDNKTAI